VPRAAVGVTASRTLSFANNPRAHSRRCEVPEARERRVGSVAQAALARGLLHRSLMKRKPTRDAAPGKEPGPPKGKGLIRSHSRGFARTKKRRPIEAATGHRAEPSICDRCGAVFSRRLWRWGRKITGALLQRTTWTRCPACVETGEKTGFGRVVIRGAYALAHEDVIRRRMSNIAARAARTQPERRISTIDRHDDVMELITTSQKLAHRIVRELTKLFRGRASYTWSDDGTLFATWERER
jgi:hypothetical protein